MTATQKGVLWALAALLLITCALIAFTGRAEAQRRPEQSGQLEDWLRAMTQSRENQPLDCRMAKRLDRDGDVVWMQMTCSAAPRRDRRR